MIKIRVRLGVRVRVRFRVRIGVKFKIQKNTKLQSLKIVALPDKLCKKIASAIGALKRIRS